MASRKTAFLWIIIAYLCCCGAGLAWLIYADGNILANSLVADVIATAVIFLFSRRFRNSSFYDAYWSVIPPLLLLYWWLSRTADTQLLRYFLISLPLWFWAIRLTWNWANQWQGLQHEDWRYPMLKQRHPRIELLTDFFGIHLFPTLQVFLGMLPVYAAVAISTREISWLDYIACAIGITAGVIQLVADRQLHRFIAGKKPGQILQSGLWGWSRHPNYFGELLFWFSMALFGLSALPEVWWWQITGFVAMLLMFVFVSIPLMEQRSLERRPDYRQVMQRISMLFPLPPHKG